jgi:hypothetical protein
LLLAYSLLGYAAGQDPESSLASFVAAMDPQPLTDVQLRTLFNIHISAGDLVHAGACVVDGQQ